jgi:hypothetical protein
MKRFYCGIISLSIVLCIHCSLHPEVSKADKQWMLMPQDLPDSLFTGYVPAKNSRGQPFFFNKTKTSLSGFSAVFEQKLVRARNDTVSFTAQVTYARTDVDARAFYGNYLAIEDKYNKFVKKTEPKRFGADEVLLIQSDRMFSLVLRKNLILYFVQIENRAVDCETVKNKILQKIDFIERHAGSFKT